MPNFHQTIIVGHLGRDPETRHLTNGDQVCNFSVAVTEKWKDKQGDQKEQTTWYRVNAFSKLAEICGKYLTKGTPVMVTGRMQSRKYNDKDGVERESWELRADSMQMLGGKQDGSSQPRSEPTGSKPKPSNSKPSFDDIDSDIPF